jgi:hypothetical protein
VPGTVARAVANSRRSLHPGTVPARAWSEGTVRGSVSRQTPLQKGLQKALLVVLRLYPEGMPAHTGAGLAGCRPLRAAPRLPGVSASVTPDGARGRPQGDLERDRSRTPRATPRPGPCAGPPPVPALVLAARAAGCPSWLLGAGRQPWTPHPTSLLPLLTRTRVAAVTVCAVAAAPGPPGRVGGPCGARPGQRSPVTWTGRSVRRWRARRGG